MSIKTNMKQLKNLSKHIIFGFLIGASILIPGLSGGTTAIILGIYNNILNAVDGIFHNFKTNICYLSTISIGAVAGFVISSFPLGYILSFFELEFSWFVIGIVVGSISLFIKKQKRKNIFDIFWVISGSFAVFMFDYLSSVFHSNSNSIIELIFIGFLSAVALILPGISLSNILISFDYYNKLIISIKTFDVYFLFKYSLVTMCAVIIFTKVLNKSYNKYPDKFNSIILGMILASIKQIYVGMVNFPAALLFISGVLFSIILITFVKEADAV